MGLEKPRPSAAAADRRVRALDEALRTAFANLAQRTSVEVAID